MRFDNVYFITGNSYAGKSTITRMLAERHDGLRCGENYHKQYFPVLDPKEFPFLTYARTLKDPRKSIRRTPEEFKAWMDGAMQECEILELRILEKLKEQEKPVFAETNISLETLKSIAEPGHVLVMLADPEISVQRFFDRADRGKQYVYSLLMEEPDPEQALENYRQGLRLIHSRERYDRYLRAGFSVILRDENRTKEETLVLAEQALGLTKKNRTLFSASCRVA